MSTYKLTIWCKNPKSLKIFQKMDCSITASVYTQTNLYEPSSNEVVLVCGDNLLHELKQKQIIPKGRKVASLRGVPIPYNNGYYYITYDPELMNYRYNIKDIIQGDINHVKQYIKYGTWEFPSHIKQYKVVDDFRSILIEADLAKKLPICLDLETKGLDPYDPEGYIISIQLSTKPDSAFMVKFKNKYDIPVEKGNRDLLWCNIKRLLSDSNIKIFGANLKYDLNWLKIKWGFDCTNYVFDTLLVGSLLDENRSNSLENHARIYSNIPGYDSLFNHKYDKSQMHLVPFKDFVNYSCADVDACYQVRNVFVQELLKDKPLTRFYVKLLHPGARAFEKIEQTGVLIDQKYFKWLDEYFSNMMRKSEQTILSYIPDTIKKKYEERLAISRGAILRSYLFTHKNGLQLEPERFTEKGNVPQIDHYHLQDMKHKYPEVSELIDNIEIYRKASKQLNTYVTGFLKHLRSDGRFHPTYYLFKGLDEFTYLTSGTESGRLSAKNPSIQTISKHGEYATLLRKGYIAPKGHIIINADFKQIELVLFSYASNDPVMRQVYLNNGDLHAQTALGLYSQKENVNSNLTLDEFKNVDEYADLRFKAKSCFDGDTELLTLNGWIKIKDLFYDPGMKIAQWDKSGRIKFVIPYAYTKQFNNELWHIKDRQTDLCITPDHRQIVKKNKSSIDGGFIIKPICEFSKAELTCAESIHAGVYQNNPKVDSWIIKLIVAIQSDGHITQSNELKFELDKVYKIERLKLILSKLQIPYSICYSNNERCKHVTTISIDNTNIPTDIFTYLDQEQRFVWDILHDFDLDIFTKEISLWNGHICIEEGKICNYMSNHRINAEIVQTAFILCNKNANLVRDSSNEPWCVNSWDKNSIDNCTNWFGHSMDVTHNNIVYCLSVRSGYVVTRRNGKVTISGNCNFLLIYRGKPKTLQQYAKDSFGIDMSIEEAQQAHKAFFDTYPNANKFHEEVIRLAKKQKGLRNPLGRIRRLPYINHDSYKIRSLWERIAINFLMQSTASDLTLYSIVKLAKYDWIKIFLMTHDSITAYVPIRRLKQAVQIMKDTMENLPLKKEFDWDMDLPIRIDLEVGKNLGEMEEYDI